MLELQVSKTKYYEVSEKVYSRFLKQFYALAEMHLAKLCLVKKTKKTKKNNNNQKPPKPLVDLHYLSVVIWV